jgi:2-phosphosulfolactate phosphatase
LSRIAIVPTWQQATDSLILHRTVVVIDVLRWSTVAITALANGATAVEAFATPEQATTRANKLGRARTLLGGERGNQILDGFDVGNSPLEYTRDRVENRIVITTTTNGTSALVASSAARDVLVAAFVNLDATVAGLRRSLDAGQSITLLCSGQLGAPSLEDSCLAGAIVDAFITSGAITEIDADAAALVARDLWVTHHRSAAVVMDVSSHAATLRREGFSGDVEHSSQVAVHSLVAVRDPTGAIRSTWVANARSVPH